MNWSLSEFLNLIELRGQSWCFVDLASSSGFSLPHNEMIFFYAALEGTARIAGVTGGGIELVPGDIAMILSGDAHALRNRPDSPATTLKFLHSGEYVDVPPTLAIGEAPVATRLLCGRLRVRWPGAQHPHAIPAVLLSRAGEAIVNFDALVAASKGSGASAVLTHLASLLFVQAFRDHPQCQALFRHSSLHDPVSRARHIIETHPFQRWTVEALARKVGMGRSNFATRFVSEIGRTPIEVLTEERMKHAATFLEKSDLKVTEIGERVGYRSEAAFSRRFTTYFGMTPGQMRKQKQRSSRASVAAGRGGE